MFLRQAKSISLNLSLYDMLPPSNHHSSPLLHVLPWAQVFFMAGNHNDWENWVPVKAAEINCTLNSPPEEVKRKYLKCESLLNLVVTVEVGELFHCWTNTEPDCTTHTHSPAHFCQKFLTSATRWTLGWPHDQCHSQSHQLSHYPWGSERHMFTLSIPKPNGSFPSGLAWKKLHVLFR